MPSAEESPRFDAYYYAHDCGEEYVRNDNWLGLFRGFAKHIVEDLNPQTVLDAGCAKGFLVETLRDLSVEAWGLDISEYAINEVYAPIKAYCKLASLTEPLDRNYDLIVSIEVLEHMTMQDAEKALTNMCESTDAILFSSSPNDFSEITHINVQPPEVWARMFARNGFYHDLDFDASFVTPWAALYRRVPIAEAQLTYNYERKLWLLNRENADLRNKNLNFDQKVREFEQDTTCQDQELLKDELRKTFYSLENAETQIVERMKDDKQLLCRATELLSQSHGEKFVEEIKVEDLLVKLKQKASVIKKLVEKLIQKVSDLENQKENSAEEFNQALENNQKQIESERALRLEEKSVWLNEKNQFQETLSRISLALEETQQEVINYNLSRSWKITRPLRWLRRRIVRIARILRWKKNV